MFNPRNPPNFTKTQYDANVLYDANIRYDGIVINYPNWDDRISLVYWVDRTDLEALYIWDWTDQTNNWNDWTATNTTTGSDIYWNYTEINGTRNGWAGTGTRSEISIGNKMNYTEATDYSWSVTFSVEALPVNNVSGIFWSFFDNAVYLSNTTWSMTVSLRGSTNVFAGVWASGYWATRLWQIHTIWYTYIASEKKFYLYLDGTLSNTWWTSWPTTFTLDNWYIGDNAIGSWTVSSSNKKFYRAEVFGRALSSTEHALLSNLTTQRTQPSTTWTQR